MTLSLACLTLRDVVVVLHLQVPSFANAGDVDVVGLHDHDSGYPYWSVAPSVLISNGHFGLGHAVDLLIVGVSPIPGIHKLQAGISVQCAEKEGAGQPHAQVHPDERWRHRHGRQPHVQEGLRSRRRRRGSMQQAQTRPWDQEAAAKLPSLHDGFCFRRGSGRRGVE